ncbi:AAA family ATPase [Parvularcula dongshanensis]|uniref:Putative ATPase n=1 Tax=Parvularcula dongshanensis TaxID=1173995 RepID=A0A840I0X9_9PROT|nr:AAA family ATPase [Parvularcula dongshanensis]MBB4657931.1 putative ATPase [Parvularcula dongshanensis]
MYISKDVVVDAIHILRRSVPPFIGITFLACKRFELSVGKTVGISLDKITQDHMEEFHRLDKRSSYYFQPFKSAKWWVKDRYPSTGLQTQNTQTYESVFLRGPGNKGWGFSREYLSAIEDELSRPPRNQDTSFPIDAIAVWLLRDRRFADGTTINDVIAEFAREYRLTDNELKGLFSRRELSLSPILTVDPPEASALVDEFPPSPDAEEELGKAIETLSVMNAGPTSSMQLDYGSRLTMITGDNGLGKSFLLDLTWWAATGGWPGESGMITPYNNDQPTSVLYSFARTGGRSKEYRSSYDYKTRSWDREEAGYVEALSVYSRADGSFAISDPFRNTLRQNPLDTRNLSPDEVWNGRTGLIEGLVRDWIKWQSSTDLRTFDLFAAVLRRLSPEDLGTLKPAAPVRIPGDPREIPTIEHSYATIPITQASSGVQRVLLLAYLIIWSWEEHEVAARQLNQPPLRRIMVIVDELEAHLHPKWQRIVLPALMGVGGLLSSDAIMQVIAASHSPMILASLEPTFNSSTDTLYHLYPDGDAVTLEELPFVKYGDVSGWLTSPLFGLRHARSREAEKAIIRAKSVQMKDRPEDGEVQSVTDDLIRYLDSHDKFWPRWIFFAEQHGVDI